MILVEGGIVVLASAVGSILWKIIKLPFIIVGGLISMGMSVANWRNSRKALKQGHDTSNQIKRLTAELQKTQMEIASQNERRICERRNNESASHGRTTSSLFHEAREPKGR